MQARALGVSAAGVKHGYIILVKVDCASVAVGFVIVVVVSTGLPETSLSGLSMSQKRKSIFILLHHSLNKPFKLFLIGKNLEHSQNLKGTDKEFCLENI